MYIKPNKSLIKYECMLLACKSAQQYKDFNQL